MKRLEVLLSVVVLTAVFVLGFARPAHAYLDPGTGSLILYILAGTVFGSLYALKTFWRSIWRFFSGRTAKANDGQQDGGAD